MADDVRRVPLLVAVRGFVLKHCYDNTRGSSTRQRDRGITDKSAEMLLRLLLGAPHKMPRTGSAKRAKDYAAVLRDIPQVNAWMLENRAVVTELFSVVVEEPPPPAEPAESPPAIQMSAGGG